MRSHLVVLVQCMELQKNIVIFSIFGADVWLSKTLLSRGKHYGNGDC